MRPVTLLLDEESYKIYKKLPEGKRGYAIRSMLKNLNYKEEGTSPNSPPNEVQRFFLSSEDSQTGEKRSNELEQALSEMAPTQQAGKKSSPRKAKDNIQELFSKV